MRNVSLIPILALCAVALFAQTAPAHHPINAVPVMVDGSKNPEQIPDLVAYQLFFATSGILPNDTPSEQSRQIARVTRKLHFQGDDAFQFIAIANDFRVRYEKLIGDHNNIADVALANGTKPSYRDDVSQNLAKLTADTVAKLQSALSSEAEQRLADVIKAEKANMQVSFAPVPAN